MESPDGFDRYFTGRFHGHRETRTRISGSFDDLGLEDALAWAHERAYRIVIRFGPGPHYAIGFAPKGDGALPWPEAGLPAPTRRRVDWERWKDRSDADPDATWEASLWLSPPEVDDFLEDRRRPEWDEIASTNADRLGGAWSAEELDDYFAEVRPVQRAARRDPDRELGWYTSCRRAYEITVPIRAPTAARARAAAEALVPGLPEGWST